MSAAKIYVSDRFLRSGDASPKYWPGASANAMQKGRQTYLRSDKTAAAA